MSQQFKLTRRAALAGAAGLGLAATACSREEPSFAPRPPADGAFKHGVASGDPDQSSIMLWTAITTEALDAPVRVELAEDDAFSSILLEAEAAPAAATVNGMTPFKLLADGLQPGRDYWYRFHFGDATSETGRTRTLPEAGVDRFTIAAFSCSNYPAGFFNAYRAAADRGDIDLVVHLGDYLYEYGRGGYAMEDDERLGRVVEPAHEIVTYEDYVTRYAQYGADPDLKALKAAAPWLTIWDDHETANNAHLTGAENHDPEEGEGAWSDRVDAALRAYYGWLPVREPQDRRARYGALEIGDLATLIFLESRLLARSDEMTLDDFPVPLDSDPEDPLVQETVRNWLQARVGGEDRTLLGAEQFDFVIRTLEQSVAAGKPWRIFANQVLMGSATAPDYTKEPPLWLRWGMRLAGGQIWDFARQTQFGVPMTLDTWDGFPAERERLFSAAREANADFIVLTGDSHNFWTVDLKTDGGERVGVEFGVTSVTSPSDYEFVNAPSVDFGQMTLKANPHILHHSVYAKGFVLLTLTPEEAVADFVSVSTIKDTAFEAGLDSRWRVTPALGGPVAEVERLG
jgi:phosphodiesterase/alkaline phosphatase D-like protein